MIRSITSKNFKRFGRIIEYPQKSRQPRNKNLFRIVARNRKVLGWRIAYLVVREKNINRLEQHPESLESFEPVKGKCLLYLVSTKEPSSIECFRLEKPVILNKGIWHGVVTLSRESEIKITENAKVKCIYWRLPKSINLGKTYVKF